MIAPAAETPAGMLVVKSVVETEQVVVNAKGEKTTKLVPSPRSFRASKSGHATASNICKVPSDKVSVNLPVPGT